MSWFQDTFGFPESRDAVHLYMWELDGWLHSTANGRAWRVGDFTTPSLRELEGAEPGRAKQQGVEMEGAKQGRLVLRVVQGEVGALMRDPANAGAVFQVASQANCLEFPHRRCVPEAGITGYPLDRTQGPAACMATPAAALWRCHLIPMEAHGAAAPQLGQTAHCQVNLLRDVLQDGALEVRNGYTFSTPDKLRAAAALLSTPTVREDVRRSVRVGVHADCQVGSGAGCGAGNVVSSGAAAHHTVDLVLACACSVAYSAGSPDEWRAVASVVLEGAYGATLAAALRLGKSTVFLTLLGAGAFGNPLPWVLDAIKAAVRNVVWPAGRAHPLLVNVVVYSAAQVGEVCQLLGGNTFFRYYDNTAGTRFFTLNSNDSHVSNVFITYNGTAVDSVLFYGNNLLQAQVDRIQTDIADRFAFFAVFDGTSRCLITRSYIYSTNTAIVCNGTANVTITLNIIYGAVTAPAVETTGTARVQAFNNIITRTSTNTFVLAAAGSVFANNQVSGTNKYTGAGVAGAIILSNDATEFSNLPNRLRIDGTAVLNAQQGAIPNDASGAVNQGTVNAILTALRAHGLIAP